MPTEQSLTAILGDIIPGETLPVAAIACWKSAASRGETAAGAAAGIFLGIGGGPKWYEFGLAALTPGNDCLYLVSFGVIAGAQVNDGELTSDFLQAAVPAAKQSSKIKVIKHEISSLEAEGRAYDDSVTLDVHGGLRTELIMLEKFVPGNRAAALRIAEALTRSSFSDSPVTAGGTDLVNGDMADGPGNRPLTLPDPQSRIRMLAVMTGIAAAFCSFVGLLVLYFALEEGAADGVLFAVACFAVAALFIALFRFGAQHIRRKFDASSRSRESPFTGS